MQGAWHGVPLISESFCASFAKVACLVCNSFCLWRQMEAGNGGGYCGEGVKTPKLPFLTPPPPPRAGKVEQRGCSVLSPHPHTWHWAGCGKGLCAHLQHQGCGLPHSMAFSLREGISAAASCRLQWERGKWHGSMA